MKVGIFANDNLKSQNCSREFISLLANSGIDYVDVKKVDEKVDLIVVFGGDGTAVRVIDCAVKYDVPALIVNTGTLGFLSDFEPCELEKVLNTILEELPYTTRTLLSVEYNGKQELCLNDLVIQRKPTSELNSVVIKLKVFLNDELVDNYFADGIIFATPTGSTAYSLSAGGCVITPESQVFIITPICSHSFLSRPIVYDNNGIAKVNKLESSSPVAAFADGKFFCEIDGGELIIKKSEKVFKLYKEKKEFFKKISVKFNRVID